MSLLPTVISFASPESDLKSVHVHVGKGESAYSHNYFAPYSWERALSVKCQCFPHCFVLYSANSNWTGTGSLSEGEDGSQPGLWSKGPVVEFYHPTTVSAQSLTRAGWPIFSYPGVIKNVLRLIYTRLLRHDIIIGMHYNSRLLWVCYVLEQAIVRWWKPIRVLWYQTLVYSSQKKRCSSPLCIMSSFSPLPPRPPWMWPKTSLHIMSSGALTILQWQQCCGGTPGGEVCIPAVH